MSHDAAEFLAQIAVDRRREREAVREFVAAAKGTDRARLAAAVGEVDSLYVWPRALRALVRSAEVHAEARAAFLQMWIDMGDHIRQEVGSDRHLGAALRLMLPPYQGPDLVLYRGDSAWNRRRRAYGMSWTADPAVALSYARGTWRTFEGGSVLLLATVEARFIVSAPHLLDNRYDESEYLVDRRGLKRVKVLKRFNQIEREELSVAA